MTHHLQNGAPNTRLSKELLDQRPPSDLRAEAGVIGSVLVEPARIAEIDELPTIAFHDPANQTIWRAMLALHRRGHVIDQTLLLAQLYQQGADAETNWAGVIGEHIANQPTASNIRYYANILKDLSAKRQLILAAESLLREAYATNPPEQILAALDQQLTEIRAGTSSSGKVFTFHALSCAELDAAEYATEYLVEWLLVAGQPCIVAGQKKALKTTILLDLAISLATCGRFLGFFRVTRSARVCVMTGESGMATIQESLRRIASAAGHQLKDIDSLVLCHSLILG